MYATCNTCSTLIYINYIHLQLGGGGGPDPPDPPPPLRPPLRLINQLADCSTGHAVIRMLVTRGDVERLDQDVVSRIN